MFVTALKNRQLGMHQNDCMFKNSQLVQMEAQIASPTSLSYAGKQLTARFHTQPLLISLIYSNTAPMINCIFQLSPAQHSQHLATVTNQAWHTATRPGAIQRIQSWILWPFCCFQTQTCFHKQALLTTSHDSTLLKSFFAKNKSI